MGHSSRVGTAVVFLLIGIATLVLALVLVSERKTTEENSERVLEKGSDLLKEWANMSTWFAVTLYNVTNADDVLNNKTSKPNVSEVGPYYYREYKNKRDVKFTSKSVVEYKLHDMYVFDRNRTAAHLNPYKDKVTNLNIPLMGVINNYTQGRLNTSHLIDLLDGKNVSVFNTLTVTEFLWGYKNNLTNETFSLYTNNSQLDLSLYSSVHTGVDDISAVGQFVTWRGKHNLRYWNGTDANKIRGTDGTFFHPHLQEHEDVILFDDCLFRSINLAYQLNTSGLSGSTNMAEQHNISGLSTSLYRYGIAKPELQNDTTNPSNAMWYSNWYSGLFNLSSATNNTPMFMSKPHFLDADPRLRTEIVEMKEPNRTEDDTLIDAIPLTGFVVNFHRRWQINVRLQPVNITFNITSNTTQHLCDVQDTLIPIAYSDRFATASNSTVNKFSHEVTTESKETNYLRAGLVAGGGLIALVSAILLLNWLLCNKRNEDEDSPLLSREQPKLQDSL